MASLREREPPDRELRKHKFDTCTIFPFDSNSKILS